MRTRSWATSLITISLLAAAPAHAGTITRHDPPPDVEDVPPTYTFTAAPGEVNDIRVERVEGSHFRLTDAGAPPTGCRPDGPNAVRCNDHAIVLELGDGDDRAFATDVYTTFNGGPGNDRLAGRHLNGGPGDDVLEGTGDANALDGGPGRDAMTGGRATDTFVVGDGEPDLVDGRGGDDIALYRDAPAGLRIDLARGRASDGDVLTSIEGAWGSPHADHLIGDDGDNLLFGFGGRDRIEGFGGYDHIVGLGEISGGDGIDRIETGSASRVDSGAGNDRVLLSRGSPVIRCGPGDDTVELSRDGGTPRLKDCETLGVDGPLVKLTRGGLRLAGWEGGGLFEPPCRIRVTAGERAETVRSPFKTSLRIKRPVTVRLRQSDRCRGAFGPGLSFRLL